MKQTAERVEAEAALVRLQLVAIGKDLRHRADPAAIVDAAKASFKRRGEEAPSFLKKNATPVGMVMLGGMLGAALTGLLSRAPRAPSVAPKGSSASLKSVTRPSAGGRANAAVLSSVGLGLGYIAGMFLPKTPTEERLLGEPKAVLKQYLDDFLNQHARGMKLAAANMFGISRLSATTLIGLAMAAEALGGPRGRSKASL